MKKSLFLFAILLANFACQNEELNMPTESSAPQSKAPEVVQITSQGEIIPIQRTTTRALGGEIALRFNTEADYQSAVTNLGKMTTKERLAYTNNFTSLQELANEADVELEKLGESATNEADFRKKYAQYVEKYSGKLITNNYDAEDLTLYVPDGDNLSTFLINENKKIVIGNQIKEVSLNNDMSRSEKAVFAAAATTNQVGGKNVHGKQKTTYSVALTKRTTLNVHIGFQKKMWYGWKRDNNRDAYYHLDASPFQYGYWVRPSWKDAPLYQETVTCPDIYFFVANKGIIDYESGNILAPSRVLTGKLYVWTDYTVGPNTKQYDRVIKDEKLQRNISMPVCDKSKAYTLDFTVNYIW